MTPTPLEPVAERHSNCWPRVAHSNHDCGSRSRGGRSNRSLREWILSATKALWRLHYSPLVLRVMSIPFRGDPSPARRSQRNSGRSLPTSRTSLLLSYNCSQRELVSLSPPPPLASCIHSTSHAPPATPCRSSHAARAASIGAVSSAMAPSAPRLKRFGSSALAEPSPLVAANARRGGGGGECKR